MKFIRMFNKYDYDGNWFIDFLLNLALLAIGIYHLSKALGLDLSLGIAFLLIFMWR